MNLVAVVEKDQNRKGLIEVFCPNIESVGLFYLTARTFLAWDKPPVLDGTKYRWEVTITTGDSLSTLIGDMQPEWEIIYPLNDTDTRVYIIERTEEMLEEDLQWLSFGRGKDFLESIES